MILFPDWTQAKTVYLRMQFGLVLVTPLLYMKKCNYSSGGNFIPTPLPKAELHRFC